MAANTSELTPAQEKELIAKLDTTTVRKQWYLIDGAWLVKWHAYVGEKVSEPPGPITNDSLLDAIGAPRPGLKKAKDYRGVNENVWDVFVDRYGGGPPIVRKHIDIYDYSVDEYFVDPYAMDKL